MTRTGSGTSKVVTRVDDAAVEETGRHLLDARILQVDLVVVDHGVCRHGLHFNHIGALLLLRLLRRHIGGLHLGVNDGQRLDVVIAGEAAIQLGAGQLKSSVQVVSGLSVEVNQLAQNLLVVVNRVGAFLFFG